LFSHHNSHTHRIATHPRWLLVPARRNAAAGSRTARRSRTTPAPGRGASMTRASRRYPSATTSRLESRRHGHGMRPLQHPACSPGIARWVFLSNTTDHRHANGARSAPPMSFWKRPSRRRTRARKSRRKTTPTVSQTTSSRTRWKDGSSANGAA
jgi:hypothetical protein